MLQQVGETLFQRLKIFVVQLCLGYTAVIFQCAYGGDNNNGGGLETCKTALDIQKLLCAQIGAESGFGNGVIAKL